MTLKNAPVLFTPKKVVCFLNGNIYQHSWRQNEFEINQHLQYPSSFKNNEALKNWINKISHIGWRDYKAKFEFHYAMILELLYLFELEGMS